jgi:putative spermidine/putrescine transport system permease protein/spermidine/putrescine transport system permease protein
VADNSLMLSLALPALLVVGAVVLIPICWLSWLSIWGKQGFTLLNYQRMLQPSYLVTFRVTMELSAVVTLVCALLGYPISYLMTRSKPKTTALLGLCVIFPMWVSPLVHTYSWLVILEHNGIINRWLISAGLVDQPLHLAYNAFGTAIGMTHVMLPFMVLPLYAAMRTVDPDLAQAATSLGASPVRAFLDIFWPLSLPGLFAGSVVVFVLSLGFYITPALLGGGRVTMWSMEMEQSLTIHADWGASSALGVVLLVVTLGILALAVRAIGTSRLMGTD